MLKNYFKSTLRNLKNKKGYTVINLIGLTLGFVCFTVIACWVLDELGYDRFHTKSDRIYRVIGSVTAPSDQFRQAVTSPPLASALKSEIVAIEEVARIDNVDAIVASELNRFNEDILLADPGFFNLFDFRMIKGNPQDALIRPYSIVLSQSMAQKYFGDENPLDKTLKIYRYDPDGRGAEYTVTGVIEDAPSQSHIQYNFLISFSTIPDEATDDWLNNSIYTYVLLREGAYAPAVEDQLSSSIEKHLGEQMQASQTHYRHALQPVEDIYLHSDLRSDFGAEGDFRYVLMFATVGLFILVLAGINYVNLATAFAIDRLKDAGIRKVHGATKLQLFLYYLFESIILAAMAFLLSLLIIELLNPGLSAVLGKENINIISNGVIYYLSGVVLLFGLLAGFLPSIYLSSAVPAKGIKEQVIWFGNKVALRKALVVFQFAITIVLLVGIFVINDQLDYVKEKDMGFDKYTLINLHVNGIRDVQQNYQPFKQELIRHPDISRVARSSTSIGDGLGSSVGISRNASGHEVQATVFRAGIDYDFVPAYGLTLLAGRNFSMDHSTDYTQAFIVNEATVKTFGWGSADQAIGKLFRFMGREGVVIGVVKNFHFSSLHNPIQPVALYLLSEEGFSKIILKAAANSSPSDILPLAESIWKKHFPGRVFDYDFVDDYLLQQYEVEQRFEQLMFLFSVLSLVIACIGLYGLAGFSSKRRAKEVGVRKVLGATATQITLMLNKEYVRLILIAYIIGSAGAWLLMRNWLEQFVYRVDLNLGLFIIAGGLAIIMVLLAVSGQSIKAARQNPVKTLKSE